MQREVNLAREFRSSLVNQRTRFSPNVESAISKAFGHATMFDIETGGLQPSSPIYEMGFQHGISNPTYRHAFVRPTDLSGTRPGELSGFTDGLLRSRESASPSIRQDILGSALSQQQAGLTAHAELAGRDIWVQNLGFERRFLSQRISRGGFTEWAQRNKLESFSPGGGIYTSSPGLKRSLVEAQAARGKMASLDTYLSKWGNVFGEIDKTLQAPRQQGVTRAFDMLDLTRSVFAMAQQQGYMARTGELYAGTSIDALSRALYNTPELHTALGDTALQGELTRFLYGTGKMMQQGEGLGPTQKNFFQRIAEVQPIQRQRNLTKNIIDTFKNQERYLAEEARGNYVPDLLGGSRIDQATATYKSTLRVLQQDGTYTHSSFSHIGRDYSSPRYSTDIQEVVNSWKARDSARHGVQLDYDKAMREAGDYIGPYRQKLAEMAGDRFAAIQAMEGVSEKIHSGINQGVSDAFSKGAQSSWLGRNWKLAAGAAAGISLYGVLFSGNDDEYNYLEGMRHAGFSGQSRRHNTDFGSGWRGLNESYKGPIATMQIEDYSIEDADTVQVMLSGGEELTLRLAGIDAPEVEHGDSYASDKVFQRQPFGERATEILEDLLDDQTQLTMMFNPAGDNTYGRVPALLFGDSGVNINLELVKKGAAASLPFGRASDRLFSASEFNSAQSEAFSTSVGMWGDSGWRAAHDVQRRAKRKITHNTFTDLERLFSNFRASSIVHRIRNPDADFSSMFAAGGRDDFNIQEGLKHGWAQATREANIGDFGSGYRVDRVIETMRKSTKVHRKLQRGQQAANTHSRKMMDPRNWTNHHVG